MTDPVEVTKQTKTRPKTGPGCGGAGRFRLRSGHRFSMVLPIVRAGGVVPVGSSLRRSVLVCVVAAIAGSAVGVEAVWAQSARPGIEPASWTGGSRGGGGVGGEHGFDASRKN